MSYDPSLIKFKAGQIRPGMSGSPLLNMRTGGICGVVSISRDRMGDLGGRAIPISVVVRFFPELIQPQAEFHRARAEWIQLMNAEQHSLLGETPHAVAHTFEQPDIWLEHYYRLHRLISDSSIYGAWNLASPHGGFVRTLISDTHDANVLYCGTGEGPSVFRSVDNGASWIATDIGLPHRVNQLQLSPHDRFLYAMTDDGVWRSKNRGASWEEYKVDVRSTAYLCVLFSRDDPYFMVLGTRKLGGFSTSTVMAAAMVTEPISESGQAPVKLGDGHLHVTDDNCTTWRTYAVETVNDMAFAPHDGNTAYVASADAGLFVTHTKFRDLQRVETMAHTMPLKVAFADDSDVIAVGTLNGLYLSGDGGVTWRLCEGITDGQVADVLFVGGDHSWLLAATTDGVYESRNGGKDWHDASQGLSFRWSMSLVQTIDGTIFVGTSGGGGVFKRNGKQNRWVPCSVGFPCAPAVSLAYKDKSLFAGGNGLYRSLDNGASWEPLGLRGVTSIGLATPTLQSADAIFASGLELSRDGGSSWHVIDSSNSRRNTVYAATGRSVFVSQDGGATWNSLVTVEDVVPNESLNNAEIDEHINSSIGSDIILSPTVAGLAYVCFGGVGLFRSRDYCRSWTRIGCTDWSPEVLALPSLAVLTREILFICGLGHKLWRSLDEGDTWLCSDTSFEHPIMQVLRARDVNRLYAVSANGQLFESNNEGVSFEPLPVPEIENVSWATLFVHPMDNYVLLGTSSGALYSCDECRTWAPIAGGVLGESYHVNCFLFANGKVFAGMREGVFQLDEAALRLQSAYVPTWTDY